jgi:hypothetical protein
MRNELLAIDADPHLPIPHNIAAHAARHGLATAGEA